MPILNYQQASEGEDDATYGATFADVKAFLPHRRWASDVKPGEAEVAVYLASVAGTLGIRIRPLPVDVDKASRLLALVHRAVVIGAAAHCEAASAPERARPNDVSSYAEWLWRQYEESAEEARCYAAEVAPSGNPEGVDPNINEPAWSFPLPANLAQRGI